MAISVSDLGTVEDTGTDQTSCAFGSFGAEASDRRLVAIIGVRDNATNFSATAVTIGGVAATIHAQTGSSVFSNVVIASAIVPTGASGSVVVDWSEAVTGDQNVTLLRVTGSGTSTTPTDTLAVEDTTFDAAISGDIDCNAGGVIIAGAHDAGSATASCAWTNLANEVEDKEPSDGTGIFSAAYEVFASAQTGRTITATFNTNNANKSLTAVSFPEAGAAYTLALDTLSYTLTLAAVGLTAQRKLTLDTLSYSLTLAAVGLTAQRKLTLDPLAYTLTLADVGLLRALKLPLDTLSYSLTLADVGLIKGYTLSLDTLAYTLGLPDLDIRRALVLPLDTLAYSFTLADVDLVQRRLSLDTLAYTLGLPDVGLTRALRLPLDTIAYALTLPDVGLDYLPAAVGDLTGQMVREVTAPAMQPVLLFEGEFASGFVRLWSGYGDLDWNAVTWSGAGTLLAISSVQNTSDIRAAGVTVDLSGVSPDIISLALAEARQGKQGTIWLAMLADDGTVVPDPVILFRGKLDVPSIEDSGDTCRVAISYESRLIDLERPRERRYTPEDQAIDYPEDKGFDEVAKLQDIKVVWGYPIK